MRFVEKRPVTYSILIWLLMLFCYVVGGTVQEVAKLPSPMGGLISTQLLAVLSLVIIGRLGWWRETGLTAPMARGGWRHYWLPLAWMVLNLALHGTRSVTLDLHGCPFRQRPALYRGDCGRLRGLRRLPAAGERRSHDGDSLTRLKRSAQSEHQSPAGGPR